MVAVKGAAWIGARELYPRVAKAVLLVGVRGAGWTCGVRITRGTHKGSAAVGGGGCEGFWLQRRRTKYKQYLHKRWRCWR